MKIKFISTAVLLLILNTTDIWAQKYLCRDAHAGFYSHSPLEDIEADNYQVTSVVDLETKEMAFQVLIKGFHFEKALMEEHFNEKYLESDTWPKSTFKGTYSGEVNLEQDGEYPVTVTGELTIHGVTQPIETMGTFYVKDGVLSGKSTFKLAVADYDIVIPKLVRDNIAKIIDITIEATYAPYGS